MLYETEKEVQDLNKIVVGSKFKKDRITQELNEIAKKKQAREKKQSDDLALKKIDEIGLLNKAKLLTALEDYIAWSWDPHADQQLKFEKFELLKSLNHKLYKPTDLTSTIGKYEDDAITTISTLEEDSRAHVFSKKDYNLLISVPEGEDVDPHLPLLQTNLKVLLSHVPKPILVSINYTRTMTQVGQYENSYMRLTQQVQDKQMDLVVLKKEHQLHIEEKMQHDMIMAERTPFT